MTAIRTFLGVLAPIVLWGCTETGLHPDVADRTETVLQADAAPPGAPPGTCWGRHVTPAIIETVTHQVVARPARLNPDGTSARPALYRTETRQEIVRERAETWFETPCPSQMTPEFVASVQRALTVRGLYRGPVNGHMDARTRSAVRRFQTPDGLDSGLLSLSAARRLGLIAVEIAPAD